MKKIFAIIGTTLLLAGVGLTQDKISRAGASVAVNADGSVTVTTASGKALKLVPQANLPGSCTDGQLFYKANVGLYQGIGSSPCAWSPISGGGGGGVGGSGTLNHLPVFTASTTLGDSPVTVGDTYSAA